MSAGMNSDDLRANLELFADHIHTHTEVIGSEELAHAFGWGKNSIKSRAIRVGGTEVGVSRGYSGYQPAALFSTPMHHNGVDPIDSAAFYAYHAAIRWGVLADEVGLKIFNSHWIVRDEWFRLPTIPWDKLKESEALLTALQPEGVVNGSLDRIALRFQPKPKFIQPVDDELVDRLDAWRDEALKHATEEQRLDERLQLLFAQLFVLRTVEDRNLAPDIEPLSTTIPGQEEFDRTFFSKIFCEAKEKIGSELFDENPAMELPSHVVSGIISDLYFPVPFRNGQYKYNFSWISSEILGLAYEKYLSKILHPAPPPSQLDMFHPQRRDVERISVRRASGVYFTPPYITSFLARTCIHQFYNERAELTLPKIVDFACGSGSFLVAAVDALLEHLKSIDDKKDWARKIIDDGCINGVDIDERAVTVARLQVWQRLAEEPNPLPLPDLSKTVVKGDGLRQDTWNSLPSKYDIILGNPPFLVTSRVPDRENLVNNYRTATGRFDFSYLFVEQAVNVALEGAHIGMVVPNRLFRNSNGNAIRTILTECADLHTIVDFGSSEVFEGTSAYVGCIVAHVINHPDAETVRVVVVDSRPTQFAGVLAKATASSSEQYYGEGIRVYSSIHPRGGSPWILLSQEEKRNQIILDEKSEELDVIAGIFQGIRTGANDIFVVDIISDDEGFVCQIENGLGEEAIVERAILRPVIFGADLGKFDDVTPRAKALIYPYVKDMMISEAEMEESYPFARRYFDRYREALSARSSIVNSGQRWYELVRRRDEGWLTQPKLLIRDLAPETSFAADTTGSMFLVGGSAVVPEREELLLPLLGYLNSKPIDLLLRRTTPQFRGSFRKFEPQHLSRTPVLTKLLEDDVFAIRLADLSARAMRNKSNDDLRGLEETGREIDALITAAMVECGISIN